MTPQELASDATREAVKSLPAAAVVTTSFLGVNWQPIVYFVTFLLVCAQLAFLLWRWRRAALSGKHGGSR